MCRLRCVPLALDTCVQPWERPGHGHHVRDCRGRVVAVACRWGRRQVAHRSRDLDVAHPRTRVNPCCLVTRGEPAVALRQQAPARRIAGQPPPGAAVSLRRDEATKATRGSPRDAVAPRNDPVSAASLRGHPSGWALLACREPVLPWGRRRSITHAPGPALGLPVCHTTALAAPRLRACQAPPGLQGLVRCAADARGHTVGQACRATGGPVPAPRTRPRGLSTPGWRRTAGRSGPQRWRRRRTPPVVSAQSPGGGRAREVEAGWLQVRALGLFPVVVSRTGAARQRLGLVPNAPARSAAGLLPPDASRGTVALGCQAAPPRLGRGQDQHRSSGAAVTHRQRVGLAAALLPHLRLTRHGAQGQRARTRAADGSMATAQDHRRGLRWDDVVAPLQAHPHDTSRLAALARLRGASYKRKPVNLRIL
jgi:hypothetical protein